MQDKQNYEFSKINTVIKKRAKSKHRLLKLERSFLKIESKLGRNMNIQVTNENETLLISLEGRLDTTTAPDLQKTLDETIADHKKLILDFEKLSYISSAGLRVLLAAQKIMNHQGEMKILHVNETIAEIFEVTGFSDILTVE